MTEALDPLAKLREPFPANLISRLPKPTKAQTEEVKANFKSGIRCKECNAWHHPKVEHLDYVGHAALTSRLLDVDPHWFWEPVALNDSGLPAFDNIGGLWIRLTICGISRLGYGNADGKTGGNAVKEVIGDALRNAAMRFGAALDLWHKGDLHDNANPVEGDNDTENNHHEVAPVEWSKLFMAMLADLKQIDRVDACKPWLDGQKDNRAKLSADENVAFSVEYTNHKQSLVEIANFNAGQSA